MSASWYKTGRVSANMHELKELYRQNVTLGIVTKTHELLSNNKISILSFFASGPLHSFLEQKHSAHTKCWFHFLWYHPVLALHTPLLAFKSMEIGVWEEGQFTSLRLLLLRITRARGRSWLLNTVFVAHGNSAKQSRRVVTRDFAREFQALSIRSFSARG